MASNFDDCDVNAVCMQMLRAACISALAGFGAYGGAAVHVAMLQQLQQELHEL